MMNLLFKVFFFSLNLSLQASKIQLNDTFFLFERKKKNVEQTTIWKSDTNLLTSRMLLTACHSVYVFMLNEI